MRIVCAAFVLFGGLVVHSQEHPRRDDFAMVERLYTKALLKSKQTKFESYKNSIPLWSDSNKKTVDVPYEMLAIQGGTFIMGSPQKDKPDEHPAHSVAISPFWMGKYEVTWDLFAPFSITAVPRDKLGRPLKIPDDESDEYIVSKPTAPYVMMDFGMGQEGYPAVNMTQHAASKFCQWLSAKTGHFYRLPTEAEWEYACRAGTTGEFSCPAEDILDYAVCEPDSNNPILDGYAKIGTKKPNPWGLYDMHGNVMEWCLDQYNDLTYGIRDAEQGLSSNPIIWANRIYPRVARGGSWYDPPADCRSAIRFHSEPAWKAQDPMLPKSAWYHTEALWLGFRIVRPFQLPSAVEMDQAWNSANPERIKSR